ncbi:MAG: hypothetical protein KKD56_04160 [Acidobacteria bacterium]|nr:hypothetical protein [Acidobacteriota bacterium]MBU1338243.1 hypothetical protein [Acidobacteriota bacterium]MBU1475130.1 hypothetical protein [Acidobacteriota bacterium]MBU2437847.1 hypothetical protein [Acidobacteriota bacterium]
MDTNTARLESKKNPLIYLILVVLSLLFLAVEMITHVEFFLHLAAIPLEVLLAIFIVERMLDKWEFRQKHRQMMHMKSYMFRSELRRLFILNFDALRSPLITMEEIRAASLDDLKKMRKAAESIRYKSTDSMEPVIHEYVKVQDVWRQMLDWAVRFNFEGTVEDMSYILNFISDVKMFYEFHPDMTFVREGLKQERMAARTQKVLNDGIQKFLDYAIDLKKNAPDVFEELLTDYVLHSGKAS